MTYDEAKRILDGILEGKLVTYGQITQALVVTGDIGHLQRGMATGMRSPFLDQSLFTAPQGTGPAGSGRLVAGNKGRDIESPWPGWSKYLDC